MNVSKEDTVWEDRQGLVRYDVYKHMPSLTYQLPNLVHVVRYGERGPPKANAQYALGAQTLHLLFLLATERQPNLAHNVI